MAYTGLPRCAHAGCTQMPMVRVYGSRHNEYDDYCEEHAAAPFVPVPAITLLEQRLAAIEQRLSALEAREG